MKKTKFTLNNWFPLVLAEYNISYFGYFATMATLSLYFTHGLHLSALLAGELLLFTSLSFRFARVLLAPIVDRMPIRRTMYIALFIAGLGYLALAFVRSVPLVAGLFLVIGIGHGLNSMQVKTLTSYTQKNQQGTMPIYMRYVYLSIGVNLMTALGSIAGNMLLLFISFRSVFMMAASLYALASILTLLLPEITTGTERHIRWGKALLLNWRQIALRRAMFATFLSWFLYTQYYSSLPIFITEGLHHQDLLIWVYSLNTLLLLTQMPIGKLFLRLRLPTSQAVVLAFLFFVSGYGLLWLFPYWPIVFGAVILWTVGEILLTPALDSAVAESSPVEYRQVAFTINSVVIGLGEGGGNLFGVSVIGALVKAGHAQLFYLLLALCTILALIIITVVGNPRESMIMRRLRGMSLVPTGETTSMPPLPLDLLRNLYLPHMKEMPLLLSEKKSGWNVLHWLHFGSFSYSNEYTEIIGHSGSLPHLELNIEKASAHELQEDLDETLRMRSNESYRASQEEADKTVKLRNNERSKSAQKDLDETVIVRSNRSSGISQEDSEKKIMFRPNEGKE